MRSKKAEGCCGSRIMKHFSIILFLLFSPLGLLLAQNVTVNGRVNKPEALIRLMVCDDLLNMHETAIAETYSNEQGYFILEGEVERIMPAAIYVGLESVDFVVSPGASYDVGVVVPDPDPSLSYFEQPQPTLRVKSATDKGRYRELVLSEMIIDDYVLNYFDQIYHRRQSRYLDSIRTTIDRELHVTDPYVLQANKYKIASIQMALNADGGKKVIQEYYDGKPVLYDCLPYMDLFKDLFKNYTLTKEFAARNPELADMVNIYQLRSLYYEDYQSRSWVKSQLQSISKQSKSKATKALVANTLERFDRFAQGAPAVDFELNDVEGKTIKLSDYKDQVVVLLFVEGNSRTVSHQLETLAELHRQWQNRVQIVTVTTKDQIALWRRRFEERRYDWPLLNLENNILLLEQYEVHTFPEYFIINKGTKIGMAPAPSPDQTLNDYVESFIGG